MKLSRPEYNHIRLDTDVSLLKDYHVIKCNMGYHPMVSPPDDDSGEFIIGARCTVVFYIDTLKNEVASYLGEVVSVILEYINIVEDREMLLFFAKDTFSHFIEHLRVELPYIDVNFISPPDYHTIVNDWVETLVKQGLY